MKKFRCYKCGAVAAVEDSVQRAACPKCGTVCNLLPAAPAPQPAPQPAAQNAVPPVVGPRPAPQPAPAPFAPAPQPAPFAPAPQPAPGAPAPKMDAAISEMSKPHAAPAA